MAAPTKTYPTLGVDPLPTRASWCRDPIVPGRLIREADACGRVCDVMHFLRPGDDNIWFGTTVSLVTPLPSDTLVALLKKAWALVRWEVPTIAAITVHEPRADHALLPKSCIAYDPVKSQVNLEAWVEKSVQVHEGVDIHELREQLGPTPIPRRVGDLQTILCVCPGEDGKFGLIFNSSHLAFDGSGCKSVYTRLLRHVEGMIRDPEYEKAQQADIEWGKEIENLLPGHTDILGDAEDVSFAEGTATKVMTALEEKMPTYHPLVSVNQPLYPGHENKTRHLDYDFTLGESAALKAACKVSDTNPHKLTMNHLVQGALCLLVLRDNPPSPDAHSNLIFWGMVGGRKRLRPPYNAPGAYPGICITMSDLVIPAALPPGSTREQVLHLAHAVRREYERQAALPGLVAAADGIADGLSAMMAASEEPLSMPVYSGDGVGEEDLQPRYPMEGTPVLEIDDLMVSGNHSDPGPSCRATQWKGRVKIAMDVNLLGVKAEVAEGWIKTWADLLLAVVAGQS
ncbi:hypothetical protein EV715DRAFT_265615 [Schizophyllum commune]